MTQKLKNKDSICLEHNIKSTIFDTSNRKSFDIPEVECDSHIPISSFSDGFTKIHKVHCPKCDGIVGIVEPQPPTSPHAAALRCQQCDRFLRWLSKKEFSKI